MRKLAALTVAAEDDVAEQAAYIAVDNPEAAKRFIEAVADTIRLVELHPLSGGRYPVKALALRGLRKVQITGFENWLMFYVERDDSLLVVRVLHGARDIPSVLND